MAVFEIEAGGKRFEVEAPDMAAAMSALQIGEKSKTPPTGRGSIADPIVQGVTFGFSDEIAGGLGGLIDLARGRPYLEGYRRTRDTARENLESYREENPGTALAAEIGGALVTAPLTGPLNLVRGVTMGGRAINAAATGGVAGGLYGLGATDGGVQERTLGSLAGLATGAVTGGVASPVLDVAGAAVRGAGSRIASTVRGALDPEAEAARRVTAARDRDIQAGAPVLTPADEAAASQTGQPVANIDRGGETVRALGRSAANTSPEARETLTRTIDDRFEGQGERASTFLRGLIRTHGNATATSDALQDAARTSRKPFYDRAYRDGANGIYDADLAKLANESPMMIPAMKAAAQSINNKRATGRAMNPLSPSGKPTLEFWDQVKRQLDSDHKVAKRQGNDELAADIDATRKALIAKLDAAVPSYPVARGVSKALFDAEDALEAGQKFVTSTKPLAEARRDFAKFTPEEKDLFREGFVSDLLDKIGRTSERRNVISQIWGSKAARDKIELVLGSQKARELEAFTRIETIMDRARTAIQGNSTTARQLAELGLAGTAGAITSGGVNLTDPTFLVTAALVRAGRSGAARIDQRVAQRVGELLASNDPAVFQRGIQMVSGSPRIMDVLRRATSHAVAPVAPRGSPIGPPVPVAGGNEAAIAEENERP